MIYCSIIENTIYLGKKNKEDIVHSRLDEELRGCSSSNMSNELVSYSFEKSNICYLFCHVRGIE